MNYSQSINQLFEQLNSLKNSKAQPVLQAILGKEIQDRIKFGLVHPQLEEHLGNSDDPALLLMNDGEQYIITMRRSTITKRINIIEPSGEYRRRSADFLHHQDKFGKNISDIIILSKDNFKNLLIEQNRAYTDACERKEIDESEIEKVLRFRNKFYLDKTLSYLDESEYTNENSIGNIFSEKNEELSNKKTCFFVLSNVAQEPIAYDKDKGYPIPDQEHIGLILNIPVLKDHVNTLFGDGSLSSKPMMKDVYISRHQRSQIYEIPLDATNAIELLKQSKPRYELSLNIKCVAKW
ncbi:MAG: hypothetical protein ACP5N2_01790 [Candidatus Nanoarchaeia archaeon]